MALKGTLYRCHLFSFAGPQTEGVEARWTYDLVPVDDAEVLSGTEVQLVVEIAESAGMQLQPDSKIRFDILEEDYLLTGGLDDKVLSLVGTGATQPDSDFHTEARDLIYYDLDPEEDVVTWIRRWRDGHADGYYNSLLLIEQAGEQHSRYSLTTWWNAERLEDYANSEFYFIVNVDGAFDDQSEPVLDVSPQRWDPARGDDVLWLPMVAGRRIYELLTTGLTDWRVSEAEAAEALEILSRLRPEDLLRVTGLMRLNGTYDTLRRKLQDGNPVRLAQFLDIEAMLDPNLGYVVRGDQLAVLVSAGSFAIPEVGGMGRAEYERFLSDHTAVADAIRAVATDGAQYGTSYADKVFVDPSRLTDATVEQLGEEAVDELVRANLPVFEVDSDGDVQLPMLPQVHIADYAPREAANALARGYFTGELLVRPHVTLFFYQRGAPYLTHPAQLARANRMVAHSSTFVPDPDSPAVRRRQRMEEFHAYLQPLRNTDSLTNSALIHYYNWLAEHFDEDVFMQRTPEDLWAESLRIAATPPPQSPLEPFLRFARLIDDQIRTANQDEKSRLLRALNVYWDWVDGHRADPNLGQTDPGDVWADAYVRAFREDLAAMQQRRLRELEERRREVDWEAAGRKLDEAIEFVVRNVYHTRDPYTVEGVETSGGFLGLFEKKRGIGYLVMPSEAEKEIRRGIGDAYLDDVLSRLVQPEFSQVNIQNDFRNWIADRQQLTDALVAAYQHPYTERYEFEVELSTFESAVEIGIGFVPIVGQVVGIVEVATGTSLFGRDLSTVERGITAAAILLPAAGKLTRTGGRLLQASRIARDYRLTTREADALYRACLPIAEGTAGNRLLREATENVRAGRPLSQADVRALENLIKDMGLADRATARALRLPPPPELTGAALASEASAAGLIRSVLGEQTAAYRALSQESRTALRAAIRAESGAVRYALLAETEGGFKRHLDDLVERMGLYGMHEDQQRLLRETLEGLNQQRRTALDATVRALTRERIVGLSSAGRMTREGDLLLSKYGERVTRAQNRLAAATDAAVRRRAQRQVARLRREQRRLQTWLDGGNFNLEEFQRQVATNADVRRLVESGGEGMVLQHWINFNARPTGRAVVGSFAEYVERMQRQFVGQFGEFEVAFRIADDWILIKVPDDMVTVPGTDLIAISRRGGPLRFIDNKAFTTNEVEAVNALTRNFTRNASADLEELGRIAGDANLPTHFRLAQARITRANAAIQARISGLTREQIASPAVQRDIANILQQENIERVVTNAGGEVTEISDELRAMGIELWDLN